MESKFRIPPGHETKKRRIFTLAFIEADGQILLGRKKRGLGKGLWNGFGGKVMEGECVVKAAIREIEEECSLRVEPADLTQFAVILFEFLNDPILFEVHVFRTTKFEGVPTESDEMSPKWFDKLNVPHKEMWPDDEIWYPLYLKMVEFNAYFLFEGYEKILSFCIWDTPFENVLAEKNIEIEKLSL